MKKSFNLAYCVVAILLLNSCEPKDKYYYLNQESKEWALYKPGTWWVYKDSVRNETDSLSVTNYLERFSIDYSDKKNLHYQIINYTITGNLINNFAIILTYGYNNSTILGKDLYLNNKIYTTTLTTFDPIPRNTDWSTVNVLPQLEVNGVVFTDVLHIRAGYSEKDDINNLKVFYHDYWLAKGKGFIKMVERTPTDTTVWLLDKYKIVQ